MGGRHKNVFSYLTFAVRGRPILHGIKSVVRFFSDLYSISRSREIFRNRKTEVIVTWASVQIYDDRARRMEMFEHGSLFELIDTDDVYMQRQWQQWCYVCCALCKCRSRSLSHTRGCAVNPGNETADSRRWLHANRPRQPLRSVVASICRLIVKSRYRVTARISAAVGS